MVASTSGPLTPAVFHILLALADGSLHGYAIMKRVEEVSGIAMGPGTIYGSLQRLTDAEWVHETTGSGSDGRRGKAFELTDGGRAALAAEAARITRLAGMEAVRRLAPEGGA